MRGLWMIFLCVVAGSSPVLARSGASAGSAPPEPSQVAELAPVTVSGVQPGPGMWKVSRGDHVMWVLGTLSPLPRNMQWQSRDLSQVISQSQQVLLSPALKLKADIGFFGKLFLLPAAYSARKNEDGKTLQQVLDASQYARWRVLKQKYLGRDRGIERWRPIFAAQALYKKALKANGLSDSGGIGDTVAALSKRFGVKLVPVTYQAVIERPRAAIKAFKRSGLNDAECFSRTMDSIEQDMPVIAARANAWATGDLQALRQLPVSDRRGACVSALTDAGFAHQLGLDDLPARLEASWLKTASTALASNRQTFAMLPMDQLLSSTGYLAGLKAQGYMVQSPEDLEADPAADGSVGGSAAAAAVK